MGISSVMGLKKLVNVINYNILPKTDSVLSEAEADSWYRSEVTDGCMVGWGK